MRQEQSEPGPVQSPEQCLKEAGMQAHIAKPLDIGKMLKTLSQVLGKKDN